MAKCKKCDRTVWLGLHKFCPNCGCSVPEPEIKKCKSCGYGLVDNDRFCTHCGKKIIKKNKEK